MATTMAVILMIHRSEKNMVMAFGNPKNGHLKWKHIDTWVIIRRYEKNAQSNGVPNPIAMVYLWY